MSPPSAPPSGSPLIAHLQQHRVVASCGNRNKVLAIRAPPVSLLSHAPMPLLPHLLSLLPLHQQHGDH
ncbi:hypothetical protein E2C01_012819 [Portunus trituberculatus]|uniref:Uncharacterized protein n=1 Tax=Portunus trituberculatus TaxID=210409 RepID=A0A5B7DF08_PORTR|nr:hypothetical protein [Portunus trituberculatus]